MSARVRNESPPASRLVAQALSGDRLQNGSPYAIGPLSVLSGLSVCDVGVLWPNGWVDQDAIWYGGIGLVPGDIVLDGDPAPFLQKGYVQHPRFSSHVYCGQTVAHLSNCWALVYEELKTCSHWRDWTGLPGVFSRGSVNKTS